MNYHKTIQTISGQRINTPSRQKVKMSSIALSMFDPSTLIYMGFGFVSCLLLQMLYKLLARSFSNTNQLWATAEKSILATLRKKTGYTIMNCKKALEMHENDLVKAENWLKEQAQAMGWSKATKLQGRQTTQGLVGVLVKDKTAALVEINCETDFVARNEHFVSMVDNAAKTCLAYTESKPLRQQVTKICMDADQLKTLKSSDGKTLSDHLALMIGTVGENATLRRAMCYKVGDGIQLGSYAHPMEERSSGTLVGRFAGLVAVKKNETCDVDIIEVSAKLAQHVVGMDPKRMGTEEDKPNERHEEEDCLLLQEYLHDADLTVKGYLDEHGLALVDFKRFACGETSQMEQPLDTVETCQ